MYYYLLVFHSAFRWLVLGTLVYSIIRAGQGYINRSDFSDWDNKVRHITATTAHIQLILGVLLYVKSPIVQIYYSNISASFTDWDLSFFASFHFILMLVAVLFITLGSARAKRKDSDREKFKTMVTWFSMALLIIAIAIPWPFSPLSSRPLLRPF